MKQGKPVITVVMVALAVALAIYFGFYVFDTFNDPFSTALVYNYTVNDSAEADGLLVREEQVISSQEGIVELTRSEGEKVGVGQTVAMVYRDSQAQDDQAALEALNQEIALLQYAATESGDVESAAKLDEEILQAVVELRASAALDDYSQLEDQVLEVKSQVLKRGYTYGEGLTSEDLSARLQDLKNQRSALSSQSAAATTKITASQSGIFSSLVDGYETVVTPQNVFQLTPSSLEGLLDGDGVTSGNGLGKLICGYRWYFAATLPVDVTERMREGGTAQVRFSGDFTQDVDMTVEQIGQEENGEQVVVFSSDKYLARTTLLRSQSVEIIFDSWSGLRIPKEALRMETYTYKDEETGEEKEGSRLGVYVLLGGKAEFKTVKVITEGSDYYVVEATSTTSGALRAGDEVITRATGLYDGQLLEF
ncbi:hypothetical protein DWX58_05260 [Pseudoflavonifractor sp. AF19-9AC]|uniref:HlyD family efflux transporter periplasmic adaptor subunit n=1 Tax=Pseudoflavonifractor sp. AF19-9AC TaxID=2292244 RepID=UPI000E5262D1|nr:HlyD family efflux transporter periplasmic adaptor subunit [Pseudoflavonifractor sp. AF19-9AC]RHR10788.1 hypothetical protein DWX58_05260 [Pseudoflavonifractor sp. AF19-9AC]